MGNRQTLGRHAKFADGKDAKFADGQTYLNDIDIYSLKMLSFNSYG